MLVGVEGDMGIYPCPLLIKNSKVKHMSEIGEREFAGISPKKTGFVNLYNISIILLAIIMFTLLSIFAPGFLSVRNLTNVLRQTAALGFLVLGIAPIILLGQIDLSLAAIMTDSAILGVAFISRTQNVILGILIIILIGIGVGAFNGFFIGKLGVVSFIVTLAVMIVGEGFAAFFTEGNVSLKGLPESYCWVGTGTVAHIPIQFILFAALAAVLHIVLAKTYIGRWVYAIGTNKRASRLCGIPIEMTTLFIFMLGGAMAAMAGLVTSAQIRTASAAMGRQWVIINYIAAATVGGISIKGGKGSIINAVVGTFIIVIFSNAINLLGIPYFTSLAIKGLLVILIVGIDNNLRR
jgi:ribose/xylose/arabinose/galactoside ABC-type transport system permease subunit